MKKYLLSIALFVAAIVLVLNLTAFKNNANGSTYIMVEIYEIPKYSDSGVHIHYGNGKTEYVPFKEFKSEHHDDNGEIILNVINKLTAEGYEISHTCAGLASSGMITKVFMKK